MKNLLNVLIVFIILALVVLVLGVPYLAFKTPSPVNLAGTIRNGILHTNEQDYPRLGRLTICTGHNLCASK